MSDEAIIPEDLPQDKPPVSSNLSVRQLARLLKKFRVQNGDILAIKYQSSIADHKIIDKIVMAMEHLKINILVVVVEDFDDFTILNEQEMNKRGWFRFDKLSKVMRFPNKDEKKQ